MSNLRIIITYNNFFRIHEGLLAQAIEIAPQASVQTVNIKELTPELVKSADIIFGWPKFEYLKDAVNLKWLQLPSAGADGYTDRNIYYNKDTLVTRCNGVYGVPIAESVMAMILAFNKNLYFYFKNKEESKWNRIFDNRDILGSTVGILGLGDIGTEVAKRAKAFGARVIAVKRTPGIKPEYVDELYGEDGIDTVLSQSDYVVLALPNTAKTKEIINEAKLKRMKQDCFFINIARGSLVDQDALIKALEEKWIAGAGLDTTTPEPLDESSPLWKLPNVIITPHSSGVSSKNTENRFILFNENLKRFMSGEKLLDIVNMDEEY